MAQTGRTVLILGAGVGGVVAASRLRKQLSDDDRVVLVDREPNHLFQSSLLWLLVGQRRVEQIQWPLARLEAKGVELVTGEITAVDAENRRVTVGGRELEGDALIIALGAELAPDAIPGPCIQLLFPPRHGNFWILLASSSMEGVGMKATPVPATGVSGDRQRYEHRMRTRRSRHTCVHLWRGWRQSNCRD